LTKKREIRSINEGITYAKDLPNDFNFGIKSDEAPENIKSILHNNFATEF
jgi:hypothetical protein